MARYTDSVCRQCRREGAKLFLKGDRCFGAKCAIVKRPTPPGQHGVSRKKQSQYGIQLREKQKRAVPMVYWKDNSADTSSKLAA